MRIFLKSQIKNTPLPFEHSRKTKSFLTSFGVQKVHKHISQQQHTHTNNDTMARYMYVQAAAVVVAAKLCQEVQKKE